MNFFECHIGDWVKRTKSLPHVRRCIYMDLIMAYYTAERPFKDRQEAYDEAAAGTKALREHTDAVLEKFFQVDEETGEIRHDRCDEEIHRYLQKIPQAEQKREHDAERKRRSRERRSNLAAQLRKLGITPAWDASMEVLENTLAEALDRQRRELEERERGQGNLPLPVTRDRSVTGAGTADGFPAESTAASPQSPVPSYSLPVRASVTDPRASAPADPAEDARAADELQEKAEKAAQAMAAEGLEGVNASDPVLREQIRLGMSLAELRDAAKAAKAKGLGVGWALARAIGRRADAARLVAAGQAGSAAAPAGSWRDSRSGVEAMGKRVGIGPWQQILADGRTEHWPAYLARVEREAAAQGLDEPEDVPQ